MFMVNVGKYTSPMDPMGYIMINIEYMSRGDILKIGWKLDYKFISAALGISNILLVYNG